MVITCTTTCTFLYERLTLVIHLMNIITNIICIHPFLICQSHRIDAHTYRGWNLQLFLVFQYNPFLHLSGQVLQSCCLCEAAISSPFIHKLTNKCFSRLVEGFAFIEKVVCCFEWTTGTHLRHLILDGPWFFISASVFMQMILCTLSV